MGTIANKLTYLNETKNRLKNVINYGGAGITDETFRSYPEKLYNSYIDIINDCAEAVYEEMPKVTEEGTDFALNNTAKCRLTLDLKGNTYQDSTVGKNLLPNNQASVSLNGLTFTRLEDGSYKLNGTSTENTFLEYYNGDNVILPAGTYTGSIIGRTNITDGYIRLGDWGAYQAIFTSSSDTNTFTINESFTFSRAYIYISQGKTFNNQIIKLQLETGSSATSWEPFTNGPAPNPDYPQPIHNVSGDNTIKICGKNLFPVSTITTQSTYIYPCKVGDKFTLSFKGYGTVGEKRVFLRTYNGDFATKLDSYVNNETITLTGSEATYTKTITSTTDGFVYFRTATSYTHYVLSNLQLEKGTTATNFVEHQEQSQLISLGSIELCKIGTYQDYIYKDNGKWYLHKEIGKVVLNGSEDWSKSSNTSVDRFIRSSTIPKNTQGISNYFSVATSLDTNVGTFYFNDKQQVVNYSPYGTTTLAQFKEWVATNKPIVYYVLATPTDTEITGTLQEQLNNLQKMMSYQEQTNINQENNDLPFIITASAIKEYAETAD